MIPGVEICVVCVLDIVCEGVVVENVVGASCLAEYTGGMVVDGVVDEVVDGGGYEFDGYGVCFECVVGYVVCI